MNKKILIGLLVGIRFSIDLECIKPLKKIYINYLMITTLPVACGGYD